VEEASSKPLGLNAASSGSIGAQSVGDVELSAETTAVAEHGTPLRLSRRLPLRLDESKTPKPPMKAGPVSRRGYKIEGCF
jgi:hypothetical protein